MALTEIIMIDRKKSEESERERERVCERGGREKPPKTLSFHSNEKILDEILLNVDFAHARVCVCVCVRAGSVILRRQV